MKILAVSDKESKYYWDFYQPGKLDDVDLILSCGDLKPSYLEFLTTFAHCPVLYVHGNHDTRYEKNPPQGATCIEDRIYVHKGIRILGLGGSIQYCGEPPYQYTEAQMRARLRRLWLQIKWHRGFDILLTHSPALGLGDGDDFVHRGFEIFYQLLLRYHPRYHLYGHVHAEYGRYFIRHQTFMKSQLINCYEKYLLDYETGADVFGLDHLEPDVDLMKQLASNDIYF